MNTPLTYPNTTAKQARRLLITMAQKRQRAGSGSSTAFLKQRTVRRPFPNLTSLLEGLPWAAVGAAATRLYMPERATNDLDILIRAADRERLEEQLKRAGATYKGEWKVGGSSWLLPEGFPLDVIEGQEAWTESALQAAQINRTADGMPILPLPYLVLMKFRASRVQDIADVSRMLGQASEAQLTEVRTVFMEWLPDETEDLESLILLGQLEMQTQ